MNTGAYLATVVPLIHFYLKNKGLEINSKQTNGLVVLIKEVAQQKDARQSFFFLLAKRRHTPPLATTHEYGLVYKDQENILSGFLGWPENELQVFFSINVLRLLCSVVAARLPLLQQFGWASPLKILIHLVCEQSCLVRGLVRFIKSKMEALNNINLPFNVALA